LGVIRSVDGGATWAAATAGLDTLRTSAVAVGANGDVVVAGRGGRIHRSVDGGDTWTPIYDGHPDTFVWDVLPAASGRVFSATQVGLYRTSASGTEWERVGEGLGADSTRGFTSLEELPSGRLLAFTYFEAYVSDDGGSTWSTPGASLRPIGPYAVTAGGGIVYAGSFGGGVYRSDDEGETWSLSTDGLVNADVLSLGIDLDGRLLAGTSQSQTPNAQRWDPASESWEGIEDIRSNSVQAWLTTRENTILAASGRGLYRSADGGETWTLSPAFTTTLYALVQAPDGALYAGTFAQGIARSTDDGQTWAFVGSPLGRTTHLAVAPDGTLYAGVTVFGSSNVEPGVIRSLDDGQTWTAINGWGTSPRNPRALAVDSGGRVFAAFGLATAFMSDDQGDSWMPTEELPPNTEVFYATGDDLLAAQRDGSIARTSDGGATWETITAEPTGAYPRSLIVDASGAVYVGTLGQGVLRGRPPGTDASPRGSGLDIRVSAYPNPFTSDLRVEIRQDQAARVTVEVFDSLGRRMAVSAGEVHGPGSHPLALDAASWAAGTYIVRVTSGAESRTRTVVKVR
ncbi:MAG: T9SS type A sorting domain-containing protein, partial [Bacteroidota bacterium]